MARADLAFEHQILRAMRALKHRPKRVLLALSGGVDSIVLAESLHKWREALQLELAVAHVHHGGARGETQTAYRTRARKFVRAWSKAHGLRFFTNARAPRNLNSEQELREFREACLGQWTETFRADAVAYAHHRDDLLETRVIRLIRGSGQQGMGAMHLFRGGKLRPLLAISRDEILKYAELKSLSWCEDPSNRDHDILRNWLRREWLPSLERQRPGSLKALARSLERVGQPTPEFDLAPYVGLRREYFAAGPTQPAREVLARYLKALGLRGYTHTHVEEILKRLCSKRENQTFDLLGLRFEVSRAFLWASRV